MKKQLKLGKGQIVQNIEKLETATKWFSKWYWKMKTKLRQCKQENSLLKIFLKWMNLESLDCNWEYCVMRVVSHLANTRHKEYVRPTLKVLVVFIWSCWLYFHSKRWVVSCENASYNWFDFMIELRIFSKPI